MGNRINKFEFHFKDEGSQRLSFECSDALDEELRAQVLHGGIVVSVNVSGCLSLAKVFIKLALGSYPNGYRIPIREDFDGNRPDALTIELRKVAADGNQ